MSRRTSVLSGRDIAWVCALACLLLGCGRIGVRLITSGDDASMDAAVGSKADSGAADSGRPDAGPSDGGAPQDAATSSNVDAGSPDAGTDYMGCTGGCQNAHGSAECKSGKCTLSCSGTFADCDGSPANGCETDLNADPRHCGHCARACDASTEECASSQCVLSPCAMGRGECDGNTAVACETDLTSSASNCGFCGNVCTATQASTTCSASTCSISSCNAGYDDCDGLYENGCEAALLTSSASCGGCGNVCPATGGGTPVCNAGTCESRCDLNGVFGMRLVLPTTWPSTSVLSAGSGSFVIWAKLQITQNGTSLVVQTTPCGQTVPDFSATPVINEKYGIVYPTSIFDRVPPLASVSGTGSLSGTKLGSSFNLARTAWLAGLTMNDPANDAWPSSSGSIMQVDADADSKPGVTLNYKTGSGYSSPPTNSLGSTRASSVYLAGRVAFSLSGTLTSCTSWSGSATVPDVDSHALGCRTTSGGTCSMSDYNYLDSNAPNYQTQPGTFDMTKLSSTATCADVRTALP